MIAHLTGTLLEKHLQRLVVDVGGVGYELLVPLSTFYDVGEPGSRVSLHVHTHVTDDAIRLFGFRTPLEQTFFERLISISGIGPKVALAVLSGIEPSELARAVRDGDLGRLTSIPGVGKKTAERIVLELKDKMPVSMAADLVAPSADGDDVRSDLLSALANLGYQRPAADKALDRVFARSESKTFEPLLREVLRELTR